MSTATRVVGPCARSRCGLVGVCRQLHASQSNSSLVPTRREHATLKAEEKAKARLPHARLPGSVRHAASTGCSRPRPALATLGRATAPPQTTRPNMARSALSCRPRPAWRCLAWHPAQANRSAPAVGWPQGGTGDPAARRAAVTKTKQQVVGCCCICCRHTASRAGRTRMRSSCAFARSWKGAET